MMDQYDIGEYSNPDEFFSLKAKRQGKFKKGGILDLAAAARGLIDGWNKLVLLFFLIFNTSTNRQ